VVVTAQFRSQNLQQTPIAITAVNAAMLEARNQNNITDLTNQAPNVQLRPMAASFGNSLSANIRGIGQADFNPAVEPGVGIYVDDVYNGTVTGSVLDLLDLDRVEILRGPQGTLAGKNSEGGAIKLYSKKPDGNGGGYVQATYGSYNLMEVRGGADFTLVPDKLFMRISGAAHHQDGYVDVLDYACANPGDPDVVAGLYPRQRSGPNCKIGEEGGQRYAAGRVALRYLPTDKLEINVAADYTSDDSELQANTLLYANQHAANPNGCAGACVPAETYDGGIPLDSRFIPSNRYASYATFTDPGYSPNGEWSPGPVNRLKSWGTSATIDYRFTDNLSLKLISAYRQYTTDFSDDNDVSPLAVDLGTDHLSHEQWSEELRLNGSILDNHVDYTLGGFYFRERTVYAARQDLTYVGGPGAGFDFMQDDPVTADTEAGFAHAVWHVTDKLNLTGGVRYTDESKDYTYVRENVDGTPFAPLGSLNGYTGHYTGSRWDWRANVDYSWTPDFMTYAQFSTGFKGGGVTPRPFYLSQVVPIEPETLDAYEVGFKSQWFDRRVQLNVAAFYNKFHNIQLNVGECALNTSAPGYDPSQVAPCGQILNVGDANIKGFEVETELHPMAGLEIDGSLSYLDFKYTRLDPATGWTLDPAAAAANPALTYVNQAPGIGKWKASAGIQYEVPIGGLGSMTPRFDVSYQPTMCGDAACTEMAKMPAYILANAKLTWRPTGGQWEASVAVENLTDKYYFLGKNYYIANEGVESGEVAPPREVSVTVKRSF
ncbi:MAG: TonB-dependent receptor, partial [Caulobacteraceae bacterium]